MTDDEDDKYSSARPKPAFARRAQPLMLAVAMASLMSASVESPRERLPPLPPPRPEDEPPHPCEGKAYSGRYGRPGRAPIPRAFYGGFGDGNFLPHEGELEGLMAQAEKRASDERHLLAAAEKRARKARKRLGK